MKGSDFSCIPLCRIHHGEIEDKGNRQMGAWHPHFDTRSAIAEMLHLFVTGNRLRLPRDLQ